MGCLDPRESISQKSTTVTESAFPSKQNEYSGVHLIFFTVKKGLFPEITVPLLELHF